jgi:hypothetical protein
MGTGADAPGISQLVAWPRHTSRGFEMSHANKANASQSFSAEGFRGAYERLAGGYTVGFEEYTADADPAELFRGLPDDRCQCPHWGVVLRGKIAFRFDDHEEVFEAGDAYYARPGHTPIVFAGSEVVEFSPTDALDETFAVVGANLAAVSS